MVYIQAVGLLNHFHTINPVYWVTLKTKYPFTAATNFLS